MGSGFQRFGIGFIVDELYPYQVFQFPEVIQPVCNILGDFFPAGL